MVVRYDDLVETSGPPTFVESMRESNPPNHSPMADQPEEADIHRTRLQRLNTVARLMDDALEVPILGFRVGLDPLLGLLPGIGDVVGAIFSGWMVITAARMGAAPATIIRMLLNLALDALLGAVPVLGDLFDVFFKANRRNLRIVQDQVADPRRVARQSRTVVAGAVLGVVGFLGLSMGLVVWLATLVWGLVGG